jgi:cation diffusion facilitator CzcD-associated flavoprotein CzcO
VTPPRFDAIVIGAGVAGLYQLHRLRAMGASVQVFEAGGDLGGTWYWNRYPGCRFDSESYTYGYSFSEEILDEWDWSEHFSAQPETLRYLNFVADRLDLRRDIRFDSRVVRATFDDAATEWEVEIEDGQRARCRWLITAIGALSTPVLPAIEGIDSFEGPAYHTARWPHEEVDFTGKRVGVIGTGATGVQVIQEIAKTAASLTVFQRTPNWCAPLHNSPIDAATQEAIRASYPAIFERCRGTFGQFLHDSDRRNALDVGEEEREAFYEQLYAAPGFGIWMANFRDVLVDEAANRTLSDFVARKIRERVHDPAVADKLVPRDHGFGTRRVPLETGYYEVYNQDNVTLVDLRETPIERITPTGIRTTEADHQLDLIVFATGFDAVTGAFAKIDIRGRGGRPLAEVWADEPSTYLGLQVPGFPNLFTLVGPHNSATFCNIPRCIEQNVEWVSDLLEHAASHGITRIEATEEAAAEWTEHVRAAADRMLFSKVDSWFTGVNANHEGGSRRVLLYAGGAPNHRKRCDEVAANGYEGFVLSGGPSDSRTTSSSREVGTPT